MEFAAYEDMKEAIEKFDGYELYGRRLRVYEDRPNKRSRSISRRSRSASRERKSARSRSRESYRRQKSRSPRRRRERSGSSERNRSASRDRRDSHKRFRDGSADNRSRSPSQRSASHHSRDRSASHHSEPHSIVSLCFLINGCFRVLTHDHQVVTDVRQATKNKYLDVRILGRLRNRAQGAGQDRRDP